MRTLPLLLLATLALAAVPAQASSVAQNCVSVYNDVQCDFAVSVFGSASGSFLAVGGDNADTYMDYCLEWICPSVAVAGGYAHAECRASSVCVAVAGRHASHSGYGYSVGVCDVLYHLCYPIREAPVLP